MKKLWVVNLSLQIALIILIFGILAYITIIGYSNISESFIYLIFSLPILGYFIMILYINKSTDTENPKINTLNIAGIVLSLFIICPIGIYFLIELMAESLDSSANMWGPFGFFGGIFAFLLIVSCLINIAIYLIAYVVLIIMEIKYYYKYIKISQS